MKQTNNNPSYQDVLGEREIKDTSIYGINKPKLVGEIEVDLGGGSSGGGVAYTRGISIDGSAYNVGDEITFNGYGFTPKKVMTFGRGSVGLGFFDINGDKEDVATTQTGETGYLLYLEQGSSNFKAFLVGFTNDGFTIRVGEKTDDLFFFYATCFSNI